MPVALRLTQGSGVAERSLFMTLLMDLHGLQLAHKLRDELRHRRRLEVRMSCDRQERRDRHIGFPGAHLRTAVPKCDAPTPNEELLLEPCGFVVPAKQPRTKFDLAQESCCTSEAQAIKPDTRVRPFLASRRKQAKAHGKVVSPQIHVGQVTIVCDVLQVNVVR